VIIDIESRNILRLLLFPLEDDFKYSTPTLSRISCKLKLSYSQVKSRVNKLISEGVISSKPSLIPNYNYLNIRKKFIGGFVDNHERVKEELSRRATNFVDRVYYLSRGICSRKLIGLEVVYSSKAELEDYISYLTEKLTSFKIDEELISEFSFKTPLSDKDLKVVERLKDCRSIERRILYELSLYPLIKVPKLSNRLFPNLGGNNRKYRTVKRVLDSLTKSRAFWIERNVNSSNLIGSSLFLVLVKVEKNEMPNIIGKVKETLKENYIWIKSYFDKHVEVFCYYSRRKDYEEIINGLTKSGLDFSIFEEFEIENLNEGYVRIKSN